MYKQQFMQLLSFQFFCERHATLAGVKECKIHSLSLTKKKQQKDDHAILVNEKR